MRQRTPGYCPKPATLAALDTLLHSRAARTALYIGYAHEAILWLLYLHFGHRFSVMDYWNHWGIETEFDFDTGERRHETRRPVWLEGVPFFFEGAKAHDLLIYDMAFSGQTPLSDILTEYPEGAVSHILLIDEARSEAKGIDPWSTVCEAVSQRRRRRAARTEGKSAR